MSKHIDTLDVQLSIRPSKKETIKHKMFPSLSEEGIYELSLPNLHLGFRYECRGYYLLVKLSHQFMVGIEDSKELENKVLETVTNFFNINLNDISKYKVVNTSSSKIRVKCKNKQITRKLEENRLSNDVVELNRIEYKNDFRMTEPDEKLAIIDILRISTDKFNKSQKGLWKYHNRTNCTYTTKNNNYVSITCYFKEYERLEAKDIAGAEKYKKIFRTEVKVKNAHLNSYRKYRDKILANYFKPEMAKKYFGKYIQPIFFTEPFFRIDVAISKIYESKKLKESIKTRLGEFLTKINEVGITETRKGYNSRTFRSYIQEVRKIGINPLCFSEFINGKKIEIKKIDNFIMFENSIEEDI